MIEMQQQIEICQKVQKFIEYDQKPLKPVFSF
jgi:hypothetical protein